MSTSSVPEVGAWGARGPNASWAIAATVAASSFATFPSVLLSGLAVLIGPDLGFGAFELGLASAVFFATSGIVSVPAGMLADAVGPSRALAVGGVLTATALGGLALLSWSWETVLPWMAIGGLGNSATQVAANVLVVHHVVPSRHGLAYGVKQSSVPLAGILAGLAVPIAGVSVGWRITYLVGASGLGVVIGLLTRVRAATRTRDPERVPTGALFGGLRVLAIGAGLATAAGSALVTFTVASAVNRGFDEPAAGLLLAFGSAGAFVARVASGVTADRVRTGSIALACFFIGAGVVGYVGLASVHAAPLVFGATLIAFAGGWGYPGLVLLTVARAASSSPARAMAMIRMGTSIGAIFGPVGFGWIAERAGYESAWAAAAVAGSAACALLLLSRPSLRRLKRD